MGIQTELTRITNAKAAIKTAIEGKGVTVPEGTLLDGMASLIESIEAGGGGGGSSWTDSYSVFATGTFTPTDRATEWSIDTGVPYSNRDSNNTLDYCQQSLIVWREPDDKAINGLVIATLRSYSKQSPDYNGGALGSAAGVSARLFYRENTNKFPSLGETIWKIDGNNNITFMAGKPYRWILLGVLK